MNWNSYLKQIRKGRHEPAPMTKTRKRAYVQQLGTICPYCGNDSLVRTEGDTWGKEPERMAIRVECTECKRHWWDVMTLTDLVEAAQ